MRRAYLEASIALALLPAGCPLGNGDDAPGGGTTRQAASWWPQPESYRLDLRYDARGFALAGSERIVLRNSGPRALRSVWLRTWANAFGGCAHRYIRVRVVTGARAVGERAGCTALELRLPAPLAPGARAPVKLSIAVTAPRRADRFGRYAGAAYFGNALPLLAVAGPFGTRLPPYTFQGESFFSLSARWRVRLTLPPGIRAATTGTTAGAVTTATARDFMIVAGPLKPSELRAGDVTVRRWSLREPAGVAHAALRRSARALTTYERWYGPYNRSELDVVEGPRRYARGSGLGMEYPELVLAPAAPRVVFHEIAHQWWYAIVGNDEYLQPWLDEGFATYAGARLEGWDGRCAQRPSRPPLTASVRAFERAGPAAYSRIVYRGGACALATLARGLGRARLDELLREVVEEHRDGVLTTAAFTAAVRAAAPEGVDADVLLRRAGIVAAG